MVRDSQPRQELIDKENEKMNGFDQIKGFVR